LVRVASGPVLFAAETPQLHVTDARRNRKVVPMSIAEVVKGFHDITIVASNVAELRRFYSSWGFRQVVDQGDDLAVFLIGANELAIHSSATRPLNAVVLSVLVDDLVQVQRQAANLGIEINAPTELRPGLVGIALLDPNGNKLEFLQPTP
jgi:hypothetical protein